MPTLSGRFDWDQGLFMAVGVGHPNPYGAGAHGTPRIVFCRALVDPGASHTCIASAVLDDLGLQRLGSRPMDTASEARGTVDVYSASLIVKADDNEELDLSKSLFLPTLEVHSLASLGPRDIPVQALIGRDVLRNGTLTMRREGSYCFST